ncbi:MULTISPECIES: DUF1097 domain-containing protein [Rhizobium]|uniref:DUF1097 domain-containing protein n=1 Tax=Rhizobium TaxID=379 RepID=UPI00027D7C45|nr:MULTISPECIES: DUF1097 domain-containing protein [Rhizobium]EJC71177.1 Protein of unknown function (DUF1097) [Rhizobium leguminosarum bv. viciae WSM1455]MBY5325519.1 DUF1097 domain-containing protein [Rhizobium leguminosarum]MBY5381394.1 DUF1097 domain-containing protein [Rhizobium leguminosarum]MCA2432766.1 DUF1097 domain-containing protein [Rhizobium leguminosarum]MCW1411821.1 DUF1097 domain-containing protein [Rhizobium acaciae]
MPPLVAAMISLGVLGAIDTYITATVFPVPVWVTFIAWASFYACGGGQQGLVKSVVSNWTGIIIASLTLLVIQYGPQQPIFVALLVGLGTSAMVMVSSIKILNFPPAIVFGFASLVGTTAATNTSVVTSGMNHPTLVAMAAMLLGGAFGLLSEIGTSLLSTKKPATA